MRGQHASAGNESRPAAVVGSGPNGLAAAVTLARAGVPVTVFEAAETLGGGTRTLETVSEGVVHDVCSAIHPLALATPFFRAFELERRMRFVVPEASYAHPLDETGPGGGAAAIAYRDLARTTSELGRDGGAYGQFYQPLLERLDATVDLAFGGSVLRAPRDIRAACTMASRTLEQGSAFWNMRFAGQAAPALLTGVAAHTVGSIPGLASAAVGALLGAFGHSRGWPVPIGGSRAISDTMVADLLAHGGRVCAGREITDVDELAEFGSIIFDTSARAMARIAGARLPARFRRQLERFAYGDGAAKVDFVLDGPIPWRDPRVAAAPTVHVGGSRAEIARAELEVSRGGHPRRPYVILAQPDGFDRTRNPPGVHTVWSYTHVPHGSPNDVSAAVIGQIERFAPGFRDRIVAVRHTTAAELSRYNANYHGGDFSAGATSLGQLLARPVLAREPWSTPAPGLYLASASVSPGPGVHGLGGWYAARAALRQVYGLPSPALSLDNERP